MDPKQKEMLLDDLDRFRGRKDIYENVGKTWKRGIYDLNLSRRFTDEYFRSMLLSTTNRSILVIEDIDCGAELDYQRRQFDSFTLSGLLNVIDGLWSNNGDGRIIEFTTNHKDQLDQLEHVILHHVWVQAVGFYLSLMVTTNSMDGLNHCLRKQRLPQLQLLRNFQGLKIPMLLLEELSNLSRKKQTNLRMQ
nr:aaa-atpase [Quercus suber]